MFHVASKDTIYTYSSTKYYLCNNFPFHQKSRVDSVIKVKQLLHLITKFSSIRHIADIFAPLTAFCLTHFTFLRDCFGTSSGNTPVFPKESRTSVELVPLNLSENWLFRPFKTNKILYFTTDIFTLKTKYCDTESNFFVYSR